MFNTSLSCFPMCVWVYVCVCLRRRARLLRELTLFLFFFFFLPEEQSVERQLCDIMPKLCFLFGVLLNISSMEPKTHKTHCFYKPVRSDSTRLVMQSNTRGHSRRLGFCFGKLKWSRVESNWCAGNEALIPFCLQSNRLQLYQLLGEIATGAAGTEWKSSLHPKTTRVLPEWYFCILPFHIFSIFTPSSFCKSESEERRSWADLMLLPTTVVHVCLNHISLSVPLCMVFMYVGVCVWTNFVTVVQSLVKLTSVYKCYT